ncbi:hypothetical protein N8I74_09375 [Chitiniphilus purpureus]|uniref:Carboxypeptidase regulatory-like domain-containing protein n=1 Tax=Chitiniphilus purpureus TaxID=2981137 RepID=A0ABY6DS88_9NEIS|nr:hypothetical protein [Chitiniphilus sp. CD1]UXY17197.1 hypothetical protein N8I74_09375 [Chitiniphilus sp. CD1]
MRTLIAVAAALALSACAAFKPPVTEGRLTLPPGQGAAMLAVTMTSFDDDSAQAGVRLQGPGGGATVIAQRMTDHIRAPGDTADGRGRLFVIPLPAGDYRITQAFGSWIEEIGGWRHREYVHIPRNDPVHIDAGRVVYLGTLHVNLNHRPDAAPSDTRERDLNHARLLWGVTDTANIDYRPLSGAAQ